MWKLTPKLVVLALVTSSTLTSSSPSLRADQSLAVSDEQVNTFAVDTQVFVGDAKKSALQTRTVFRGRRAYDRISDSQSTAVFDFENKVVRLTDQRRKLQTGISFDEILRIQAEIRRSAESIGGLSEFHANPKFIREFDASNSTITLSSPWMTYSAKGFQSASDLVERFIEFADWSARLNPVLNPKAAPAQARLKFNSALKDQNWQVTHVTRTGGPKAVGLGRVRSEHQYRKVITQRDEDLMLDAEKQLKEFDRVKFSAFIGSKKSERVATKK